MSDVPREVAEAIETDIHERQRRQNGHLYCPACTIRALVEDGEVEAAPIMELRFSKLSANSQMLHEDLTWKCGSCRTHMWSSVRISEEELETEQDRRGGLKYDPTTHPEQSAAVDRLRALGYLEED